MTLIKGTVTGIIYLLVHPIRGALPVRRRRMPRDSICQLRLRLRGRTTLTGVTE